MERDLEKQREQQQLEKEAASSQAARSRNSAIAAPGKYDGEELTFLSLPILSLVLVTLSCSPAF
eukprot:172567-Hanusia_phi.AAC.1